MPATIRQIVDDATLLIGEVAGVGVQQYGEDSMMRHTIRAFDLLFKKYHWEQYREWFTFVLDGTTGLITTTGMEVVKDFDDIMSVHRDGERQPLPSMSKRVPPSTITGTRAAYWTSLSVRHADYATKKIQIFPIGAIGSINVAARIYPIMEPAIDWDWEDSMYLDRQMLVYGTAFMALISDGLNPTAAETCKGLMQTQFDVITAGLGDQDISIDHQDSVPNQWYCR